MYLNLTHLIKAYRSKHVNFLIINLFKQIAFAQKDLPFTSYCMYNVPQQKRSSDIGYKNTHSFGVQERYDIDLSFTFFSLCYTRGILSSNSCFY